MSTATRSRNCDEVQWLQQL